MIDPVEPAGESGDWIERMRELSVTLIEASRELGTLYGPIWNAREGLEEEYQGLQEIIGRQRERITELESALTEGGDLMTRLLVSLKDAEIERLVGEVERLRAAASAEDER
jgi:hypothetical protein